MKVFESVLIVALTTVTLGCSRQASTMVTHAGATPTPSSTKAGKAPGNTASAIGVPTEASLATPSDTYRTACDVRKRKDVEGMKRILSKEVIAHLTKISEGMGITLDEEIATMFKVAPPKKVATRNEKINGDRATIEYLLDEGAWKKLYFVKEGDEWKYALPANDGVD